MNADQTWESDQPRERDLRAGIAQDIFELFARGEVELDDLMRDIRTDVLALFP